MQELFSFGDGMYEFGKTIHGGKITVKLTPEQEQKLGEKPSEFLYKLGFFHPDQVVQYSCSRCDKTFTEKPVIDVYIRSERIQKTHASADVLCKCRTCDSTLYLGSVFEDLEKIPAEFILIDETGDYKKPTPESIEDLLKKVEDRAKEGRLDEDNINICRRWAEKISYILDEERIKSFSPIQREAYLRNFEKHLPSLIERIKEQSSYAFTLGFSDVEGHFETSPYDGSGLSEYVSDLLENLPNINLPEDAKLKEDILKILFLYRKMHDNDIEQAINEKEEIEKKFNSRIEAGQNASRETTHLIMQYCEKAGIGKEKLDKIADEARGFSFLDATLNYAETGDSDGEENDEIPF